ncbi:DUF4838 domain-containing protein [Prolixibacteraceae bacterium Z1-6]|uniref:DUF4838 domain-containing protein n=1 Tax=Draconibacterium aestuarii TaxID=2998507 RepID=A0A9X3J8L8_9BACT|nr:DUF4838 domain-containing protein [Prolixibacteraceae bacterium Z1-6]
MKETSIILLLLLLLVETGITRAQSFKNQTLKPEQWLKDWLLVGPIQLEKRNETSGQWRHISGFETDYLASVGGEANPNLNEGKTIRFKGGKATCVPFQSTDSTVNLDMALSKESLVLAYGYTEIDSPEEQMMILGLGSNDGCRVWLNGEQILDVATERGLSADDDLIPVSLKKGKNKLLIKVEERGGSWGFCARFLPFSLHKLKAAGKLFYATPKNDGTFQLKSGLSENRLSLIINDCEYELFTDSGEQITKEIRQGEFIAPIQLPSNTYKGYVLKMKIVLRTGDEFSQTIPFYAGKRITYPLFSNGKSNYRILVANDASESEKWAARELQHWIQEVGDVELPVETVNPTYSGPKILVGYNELTAQKTSAKKPEASDETCRYFNDGADIVIYGGSKRGTMYGVMSFLENELGCRWYTPSVSMVPQKTEYAFERLLHTEKPGVRVRNDFYFEAFNPVWAARNKMNGTLSFDKINPQPGGTENYRAVHTFYPLMSPSEFYDNHPEYYSLIDGKRIYDHAQLCLTNPDVLKIVTERTIKTIRENPDYLIYSVSQNDWRNPCQCDKCQAIAREEGSESGPVIWFVNQVAEAVEKEFPDKYIGTLAYQYTRTPPKNISPRKNVVIRLCSIECCFSHDFETCPENRSFINDLKGWAAISPQLYIWDYVVNFSHYIMPYPNFGVLQTNIQTLRNNKAIGIMEQAAYQSRGGEFAELRAYLISKLLWNPECNVEKVIDDFMFGYYGRSGQYVREYFDMLQNRVTPETHIHLGLSPDDVLFSGSFVEDAEEIFRKAEKVADNPEILKRVEMVQLPILYLKCRQSPEMAVYDGTYAKFTRIVEREGITHYAESGKKHRDEFHQALENIE